MILLRVTFNDDFVGPPQITECRPEWLRSGRPNGASPKSFSAVAKMRFIAFRRRPNLPLT